MPVLQHHAAENVRNISPLGKLGGIFRQSNCALILCFAGPVRRPVDRAGRLGRMAHGEACWVSLSGAPHRCPRDDARALGPDVGVVRGGGRLSRSVEGDGRARAPSLPLDGGRGLLADAVGGPAVDKSRDGAARAGFRVAASSFVDGPWSGGPGWPRPLSWGCLASPPAGRALTIQAVERFEHRARTEKRPRLRGLPWSCCQERDV